MLEKLTLQAHEQALLNGVDGWVEDTIDAAADFRPLIKRLRGRGRILVVDASNDIYTPPQHGRALVSALGLPPSAHITMDTTHGDLINGLPYILKWFKRLDNPSLALGKTALPQNRSSKRLVEHGTATEY